MSLNLHFHQTDLPPGLKLGKVIAVDTETMGLYLPRDRLCLVQIGSEDGQCHVVRIDRKSYDCPNLKIVLSDPSVLKIFHFGRFDLAALFHYLKITCAPVYCTKIASKLVRTFTDRHGLKELCRELLGVEISKQMQTSDWGAETLSEEQLHYAATDVLYLHQLKNILDAMLARENRTQLAQACFDFLPYRAQLDLLGFEAVDLFVY